MLAHGSQRQSQPVPLDCAVWTCFELRLGRHPRQQSPVLPCFVNPVYVAGGPEGTTVRMLVEIPNNPSRALLQRFYSAWQLEMYFSYSIPRCQHAREEDDFTRIRAHHGSCQELEISKVKTEARTDVGENHSRIGLKAQGWKHIPRPNRGLVHRSAFYSRQLDVSRKATRIGDYLLLLRIERSICFQQFTHPQQPNPLTVSKVSCRFAESVSCDQPCFTSISVDHRSAEIANRNRTDRIFMCLALYDRFAPASGQQ